MMHNTDLALAKRLEAMAKRASNGCAGLGPDSGFQLTAELKDALLEELDTILVALRARKAKP